jgi:hypothetical protein
MLGVMERDALLEEALDDLRHDLGKYLVLPLRMLPQGASPAELLAALSQALLRTRSNGEHSQSARAIWLERRAELAELAPGPRLSALEAVVESALAWQAALGGEQPLDRARIERELGAVSGALEAWLAELRRG